MNLSDLQRLAVKEAYTAYLQTPTSAQKAQAKILIHDEESTATSILIAARYLLGPVCLAYEPETLWLELDLGTANRNKLMAALSLASMPSFYWDYRVFGATTHALNNEAVVPEDVPRCQPEQMAWSVFEGELIYSLTDGDSTQPEFEPSVAAYAAVSLFDEGMVVPPIGLGFVGEELLLRLSHNPDARSLQKKTEENWAALPKEKLEQRVFENSSLGAQLQKLTSAWLYVQGKTEQLRRELASLLKH